MNQVGFGGLVGLVSSNMMYNEFLIMVLVSLARLSWYGLKSVKLWKFGQVRGQSWTWCVFVDKEGWDGLKMIYGMCAGPWLGYGSII